VLQITFTEILKYRTLLVKFGLYVDWLDTIKINKELSSLEHFKLHYSCY